MSAATMFQGSTTAFRDRINCLPHMLFARCGARVDLDSQLILLVCMKTLNLFNVTLSGLALLAAVAVTRESSAAAVKSSNASTPAPSWELTDLAGKTVRSADLKGKVVILNFWATWCGPCRAEIPDFIALQKQYGSQGLVIVGASVDQAGPEVVKKFVQQQGMNYPVAVADSKMQDAFGGIEAIPTTFVIDRQGNIVGRHVGLTPKEDFESEIEPLLKQ